MSKPSKDTDVSAKPLLRQEVRALQHRLYDRVRVFADLVATIESLHAEVKATRNLLDAPQPTQLHLKLQRAARAKNEELGF